MKVEHLSVSIQTMYADLIERAWTGATTDLKSIGGSAYTRTGRDGRRYLYWQPPTVAGVRPSAEYIGIDDDVHRARLAAKQETAAARKDRRDMVRALRAARLPAPDALTGNVLAALAEAGVFRLRAAVVGSVAFQCYPGLLGVRIPASLARTGDLDIAQFHSIAVAVNDEIDESLLSLLRRVDKGFTEIPSPTDTRRPLRYALKRGTEEIYSVDVLCPLRGPEREQATYLRALRSYAQTLRHLDFLLYHEVNAVVLHGPGLPINVPAPERYALHKVLVSQLRAPHARSQAKVSKDVDQAAALIAVLRDLRPDDLADAWAELLARGPSWRRKAAAGLRRLPAAIQETLLSITSDEFRSEMLAVGSSAGMVIR